MKKLLNGIQALERGEKSLRMAANDINYAAERVILAHFTPSKVALHHE